MFSTITYMNRSRMNRRMMIESAVAVAVALFVLNSSSSSSCSSSCSSSRSIFSSSTSLISVVDSFVLFPKLNTSFKQSKNNNKFKQQSLSSSLFLSSPSFQNHPIKKGQTPNDTVRLSFLQEYIKVSLLKDTTTPKSSQQRKQQETKLYSSLLSQSPYNSVLGRLLSVIGTVLLVSSITVGSFNGPALAENELSARYGNKGFDTTLVDQKCLLDHCSIQAKACIQDDPNCRKGLTCTAKCLGDNACITGCMARYGNTNLDSLLKCTIEDNECIKIAILPGGSDEYGTEPLSPIPVVQNFDINSMTGSWYKVIGYNPNYDCYACQRNTFSASSSSSTSSSIAGASTATAPQLNMQVQFAMPYMLPDGSPLPPLPGIRESLLLNDPSSNNNNNNAKAVAAAADDDDIFISSSATTTTTTTTSPYIVQSSSMKSIGLNEYSTQETMVFDQGYYSNSPKSKQRTTISGSGINTMFRSINNINNNNDNNEVLVLNEGTTNELSYHRTAHSEGEMFGLKFWENWYIIGENDPKEQEEFKFIYYNGKTRQNTYNGAFVYSRTKDLSDESMKNIYQIAKDAGMDPNQFCRIRNGCFPDDDPAVMGQMQVQQQQGQGQGQGQAVEQIEQTDGFFRGILASTRISELLGVEPVAARDTIRGNVPTAKVLTPQDDIVSLATRMPTAGSSSISSSQQRPWWNEVGDYLENPHRHFQVMDDLRVPMVWPDDVTVVSKK